MANWANHGTITRSIGSVDMLTVPTWLGSVLCYLGVVKTVEIHLLPFLSIAAPVARYLDRQHSAISAFHVRSRISESLL